MYAAETHLESAYDLSALGWSTSGVVAGEPVGLDTDPQPHIQYFFGLAPTYADRADVILARGKELTDTDKPKVAVVALAASRGDEFKDLVSERCDDGKCELVATERMEHTARPLTLRRRRSQLAGPISSCSMAHPRARTCS
jgi:hypothetical protein